MNRKLPLARPHGYHVHEGQYRRFYMRINDAKKARGRLASLGYIVAVVEYPANPKGQQIAVIATTE